MKMEPIEGSETSAVRTKTPGNYPKENILHEEYSSYLPAYENGTDNVPKCLHIKFRRKENYPEKKHTWLVLWEVISTNLGDFPVTRPDAFPSRCFILEAPATFSVVRQTSCHVIDGNWVVTASFLVHAGTCTAASFFTTP